MQNNARILGAEAFGTAVLVLASVGTAVLNPGSGALGVALAAGMAWLVMTYVIGPISGAQMNPAVTLGLVLTRRIGNDKAVMSVVGQLIGAGLAAFTLWSIGTGSDSWTRARFAANGYDEHSSGGFSLGSVMVAEMVFTALLVAVVLLTTTRRFSISLAGAASGLTLFVITLVMAQIDGTGTNPARSIATALFADGNTDALKQLWVFVVFPLIGAVVGVFLFLMLDDATLEDTMLDNEILRSVRDAADSGIDIGVDVLDGKDV